MKTRNLFLLILFCFVIPNTFGQGEATGNFNVYSSIDTNAILIGQQTWFSLKTDIPAGNSVAWPLLDDSLTGQIEIIKKTKIDTAYSTDKSRVFLSQRFNITSFDTGFLVIPPVRFQFNNDSTNFAETELILLSVQGVAVDTSQAIKDIKEPLSVPFNFKEVIPYVLIGLAALAAIALIVWFLKRKKKKIIVIEKIRPKDPPHLIALQKLKELEEKKLWQKNEIKQYYIELSDIIREYVEFRFDFIALEMTTDEIFSTIKSRTIDPVVQGRLQQILLLADLVKFAKASPLPSEHQLSYENAVAFVKGTMPIVQVRDGDASFPKAGHALPATNSFTGVSETVIP